jgi:hypothetical protein|tara:strand:+ start:1012 stop:1638 length:627 start_codon:yes stop_codon:yes gene_type:complete
LKKRESLDAEHSHSSPSPMARATTEGTRRHFPHRVFSQHTHASFAAATPSIEASIGCTEWIRHAKSSISGGGVTPGGRSCLEGVELANGSFGGDKSCVSISWSAVVKASPACVSPAFPLPFAAKKPELCPAPTFSSCLATAAASVEASVLLGACVEGEWPPPLPWSKRASDACASDAAVANGDTGEVAAPPVIGCGGIAEEPDGGSVK